METTGSHLGGAGRGALTSGGGVVGRSPRGTWDPDLDGGCGALTSGDRGTLTWGSGHETSVVEYGRTKTCSLPPTLSSIIPLTDRTEFGVVKNLIYLSSFSLTTFSYGVQESKFYTVTEDIQDSHFFRSGTGIP